MELKDCQTESGLYQYSQENKVDWWIVFFMLMGIYSGVGIVWFTLEVCEWIYKLFF